MKLVIHPPVESGPPRPHRGPPPARWRCVNAADEAEAVRDDARRRRRSSARSPRGCSRPRRRLRWVQAPTASLEHYLFPELVGPPVRADQHARAVLRRDRRPGDGLRHLLRPQPARLRPQRAAGEWAPVGGEAARVELRVAGRAPSTRSTAPRHLADATLGVVGLGRDRPRGRPAGRRVRDARRRRRSAADGPAAGGRGALAGRTSCRELLARERLRRDRRPAHARRRRRCSAADSSGR